MLADIHGCFSTVEHALEALDYDASRDRLFSLGDLLDYGTRCEPALEWMTTRFTISVAAARCTAMSATRQPSRWRLDETRDLTVAVEVVFRLSTRIAARGEGYRTPCSPDG